MSGNIAVRLSETARSNPDGAGVVVALPKWRWQKRRYEKVTFRQLDEDSDRIAAGLTRLGVKKGMRIAMLVPHGIDFITIVFSLFKAGAVVVLIDPGIGRKNLVRCLVESSPEGFVAIPFAHAVRTCLRSRFPKALHNVTAGRAWFWHGPNLDELRRSPRDTDALPKVELNDPAAIIFTSGSTGPPKGVLYSHRAFNGQVDAIRDFYGIQPGEIDVSCFPLFALFNCAMGVTTVIPEIDPTRPAKVNPAGIVEVANEWNATQSFASPAVWNRVGEYCRNHQKHFTSLKRVLTAGAPAPPRVLRDMLACVASGGDIHTPYGATEALPIASISASEVTMETAALTEKGAGTCVGRSFPGIHWKVIEITDDPINSIAEGRERKRGEIGELIVAGDVVTREYLTRREWNALAKIPDGETIWHRMGDVGYLDDQDRFWFCGRKSHRVIIPDGVMFTEPCEAIFNTHPDVLRSALVGIGPRENQTPVIVLEPWAERRPRSQKSKEQLLVEIAILARANAVTSRIEKFLLHPSLPVDIRHNAKISREKLADWASHQF